MVQVISQKIFISFLTLFLYSFVFAQESSQPTPNGSTSSTTVVNPDEPSPDPSEMMQENQAEPLHDSPADGTLIEPNGYEVVPPGSEFPEPPPEFYEEDERGFREDHMDSFPNEEGISPEIEEIYPAFPEDEFPICPPYDTECLLNQDSEGNPLMPSQ